MKKTIIALCMVFVLMASIGFVVAEKNQQQKQDKEFALPDNAVEVSQGVFYLGKSLDKGKFVEGYAFLIKDNQAKKAKPSKDSSCYGFLSTGAKWKTIENYLVDSTNSDGLDESFVTENLASSISKWEIASGVEILGNKTDGIVDGADLEATDGKNEVMFEDLGETSTIAFAIVWGTFSAPKPFRELVEWDMVFNDHFVWGNATLNPEVMDFENIATHELGHAVGMSDLYNTECSEQTMYGYSTEGETKKRDLNTGDILGIQTLY